MVGGREGGSIGVKKGMQSVAWRTIEILEGRGGGREGRKSLPLRHRGVGKEGDDGRDVLGLESFHQIRGHHTGCHSRASNRSNGVHLRRGREGEREGGREGGRGYMSVRKVFNEIRGMTLAVIL